MTPVTSLAFGPLLKRARRGPRLTQAELVEHAGFSVVYISMLERGAGQPQRTTVALHSEALGLSPSERVALKARLWARPRGVLRALSVSPSLIGPCSCSAGAHRTEIGGALKDTGL